MTQQSTKCGIPIVAHRGCINKAPENTLEGFRKAFDYGADAIELDIRETKDGNYVIIHDETVDRTTNGSGAVNEMKVPDIKKLNIQDGFEIPTLTEALSFFSEFEIDPWFEIKEAGIASEVVEAINQRDLAGNPVIFASHRFIDEVLGAAKEGGIRAGISVGPAIAGRYPFDALDPFSVVRDNGFGAILVTPENISETLVLQSLNSSVELGLVIDL